MVWEAAWSAISFLLLILSAYIFSNTVTFEFLPLESLDDIVDYKRLFVTSPILLMDIFMINWPRTSQHRIPLDISVYNSEVLIATL